MTSKTLHSQGFIRPSHEEIEAGIARAHVLRAEAFLGFVFLLKEAFTPRLHLAPRHVAGCHADC